MLDQVQVDPVLYLHSSAIGDRKEEIILSLVNISQNSGLTFHEYNHRPETEIYLLRPGVMAIILIWTSAVYDYNGKHNMKNLMLCLANTLTFNSLDHATNLPHICFLNSCTSLSNPPKKPWAM